jgi:histone deacetylase 6
VAIVDWDYHHGDGQQKTFYRDSTVLTISLHVAMERNRQGKDTIAFPGNKGMDLGCNGAGEGHGYNINIPWPHDKVGASDYQKAFQSIVLPALKGFDPELILVASGFDACEGDTLAGTCLRPSCYYGMTRQLLSLRKPVAVILEGGYSPDRLAQCSLNVTHALLGRAPPAKGDAAPGGSETESEDCSTTASEREEFVDSEVGGVLEAVRRQLNTLAPWSGMRCPGGDRYFHEDWTAAAVPGLEIARKLSERIQRQAFKD